MPKTVELIVSLKVPDNTAITALQTLRKLGFAEIKDLQRSDYYKFSIDSDPAKFKERISKVDVIANANKHSVDFSISDNKIPKILVRNTDDDGSGLLALLKNRLGFSDISKVLKGTLWSISIEGKDQKKISEKAAKELLVNENYQEYSILVNNEQSPNNLRL